MTIVAVAAHGIVPFYNVTGPCDSVVGGAVGSVDVDASSIVHVMVVEGCSACKGLGDVVSSVKVDAVEMADVALWVEVELPA